MNYDDMTDRELGQLLRELSESNDRTLYPQITRRQMADEGERR